MNYAQGPIQILIVLHAVAQRLRSFDHQRAEASIHRQISAVSLCERIVCESWYAI